MSIISETGGVSKSIEVVLNFILSENSKIDSAHLDSLKQIMLLCKEYLLSDSDIKELLEEIKLQVKLLADTMQNEMLSDEELDFCYNYGHVLLNVNANLFKNEDLLGSIKTLFWELKDHAYSHIAFSIDDILNGDKFSVENNLLLDICNWFNNKDEHHKSGVNLFGAINLESGLGYKLFFPTGEFKDHNDYLIYVKELNKLDDLSWLEYVIVCLSKTKKKIIVKDVIITDDWKDLCEKNNLAYDETKTDLERNDGRVD